MLGSFDNVSWFCDTTRWACTVGRLDYEVTAAPLAEAMMLHQLGDIDAAIRRIGCCKSTGLVQIVQVTELALLAADRRDALTLDRLLDEIGGTGPLAQFATSMVTGLRYEVSGHWAEADRHWSSVTDLLPHHGPLPAWLLLQRATAALHVGDVQAAVEAVGRVSHVLETCDMAAPLLNARALVIRARCSLAVGATSDAQTNGHAAIGLAVDHRLVLVQIDALDVIADIALARRNSRLARRLDAACDAHRRRIGYFAGFTAVRFEAGADATARSCALEDRVLSLGETITLARRSRGARRRPSFGSDSLTPTERSVASLVAVGRTSRPGASVRSSATGPMLFGRTLARSASSNRG